jgi:hypothetical protein
VTNEAEDKDETGGGAQDEDFDAEQDRPTVAPPFDPVAFAQEVLGGRPSPATGTPAVKPAPDAAPPARTTPLGLGRATLPTVTDPAELEAARQQSLGSRPAPHRPTPRGLLSLANARIPSNIPPRRESTGAFAEVDREWEELATSPPPPMQQELIDAMARESAPSAKEAPDLASLAVQATSAEAIREAPSAREMNDRVSLGDYTGALEVAERLLAIDPHDAPVRTCAESCRGVLKQMYTTRIGPLDRAPVVMVARDQLRWLSIDHRAGFVLSLVDGVSSVEMILDVSGMAELDALRILAELAQQRIIAFR